MPDPTFRLEDRNNHVAVITQDWINLSHPDKLNPLTKEYPDFFTTIKNKSEGETNKVIRVGTAMHPDQPDNFCIHGANGIYAEVPLVERELTDSEIEWCEDTIIYSGDNRPDTIFEFVIPEPEDLRQAILHQNIDAFPELSTRNPNHSARHNILTSIQEALEEERFRQIKLSSLKGQPIDLDPEWDPENPHNEDRTQDVLNDMAGMRSDAHYVDFKTVAGYYYDIFFAARARVLDIQEPKLSTHEIPALDVVGEPDWSYCRLCGGVQPEKQFLHVQRRGRNEGETLRSCDDCAEKDYGNYFTESAVAIATDNRAQRLGGQRRVTGEYETSENQR